MLRLYTDQEVLKEFGDFAWNDNPRTKGAILIASTWIKEHILYDRISGYHISAHRELMPTLRLFFPIAKRKGWIKTYDGCWVPRHKTWDNTRGLSRHSWGIAIDLNAKDNPYGKRPGKQPVDMIVWLETHGLKQLQNDQMHFEMATTIT